jgi:hypothetical protein
LLLHNPIDAQELKTVAKAVAEDRDFKNPKEIHQVVSLAADYVSHVSRIVVKSRKGKLWICHKETPEL